MHTLHKRIDIEWATLTAFALLDRRLRFFHETIQLFLIKTEFLNAFFRRKRAAQLSNPPSKKIVESVNLVLWNACCHSRYLLFSSVSQSRKHRQSVVKTLAEPIGIYTSLLS